MAKHTTAMNKKYRLLIVDPNPYVADILAQTLQNDFYITIARTGQEAARVLLQDKSFDFVVTELAMDGFSGLDLTKLIRTSGLINQTSVIVLSSVSDSDTRIKCFESGVDDFVAKPFNPLEIRAKLNALLRRSSLPVYETPARPLSARRSRPTGFLRQIRTRVMSLIL